MIGDERVLSKYVYGAEADSTPGANESTYGGSQGKELQTIVLFSSFYNKFCSPFRRHFPSIL